MAVCESQETLWKTTSDDASPILEWPTGIKPTCVFDTYWRFAAERQSILMRRARGDCFPWTDDPIFSEFKFTNAYRAADRVSQFLIREVIYEGEQSVEEVFFRTILFKLFNKIETWNWLVDEFGFPVWKEFDLIRYDELLESLMESGKRIYSAAYIMPSAGKAGGRKHTAHLRMLIHMMNEAAPQRIAESNSMEQAYNILLSYPMIGPFLAYQYVTDLNYSDVLDFDEMEFVVPGPGAIDGIHKCFSDLGEFDEADIIRLVCERQELEFDRLGIDFKSLWGRPLQLIDCQNLFCEISKYSRVKHPEIQGKSGRTRIKQKFKPTRTPIDYWFPPKWGINDQIEPPIPPEHNVQLELSYAFSGIPE